MLKRIILFLGTVIALGGLIAAKPKGIDNTVNLLESAESLYSSDQPDIDYKFSSSKSNRLA